MGYTITGKIRGKRNTRIGDNEVKRNLSRVLGSMIVRCYSPRHKEFKNYGGKGIKICDEWLEAGGLDAFYEWAIKNGFTTEKLPSGYNKLTIDRIDSTKDYSPDNCRWVDRREQRKNTSDAYWVEYKGKKDTLISFCRELGLPYHAVYLRIKRRGWSVEKALSTPLK